MSTSHDRLDAISGGYNIDDEQEGERLMAEDPAAFSNRESDHYDQEQRLKAAARKRMQIDANTPAVMPRVLGR